MDEDELIDPYDPMVGGGQFIVDTALKIDMIKDPKSKRLVYEYLRKVSASLRVPMGEVVEVDFREHQQQQEQ
jgi:hypothetical protein